MGQKLMLTACGIIAAVLSSHYALSPILAERRILKKVRKLEEDGQFEEARNLALSTDFKNFHVDVLDLKEVEKTDEVRSQSNS